ALGEVGAFVRENDAALFVAVALVEIGRRDDDWAQHADDCGAMFVGFGAKNTLTQIVARLEAAQGARETTLAQCDNGETQHNTRAPNGEPDDRLRLQDRRFRRGGERS